MSVFSFGESLMGVEVESRSDVFSFGSSDRRYVLLKILSRGLNDVF